MKERVLSFSVEFRFFLYFEFCVDGPFKETKEQKLAQARLFFIAKIAEEDQQECLL